MASPHANYPPSSAANTASSQAPLMSFSPHLSRLPSRGSSRPSYIVPLPMASQASASFGGFFTPDPHSTDFSGGSCDVPLFPDELSRDQQQELVQIHSKSLRMSPPPPLAVLKDNTSSTACTRLPSINVALDEGSRASYTQTHTSSPSFVIPPLPLLSPVNVAHAASRYTQYATLSVTYNAGGPISSAPISWTVRMDAFNCSNPGSVFPTGRSEGPFTVDDFEVGEDDDVPYDIASTIDNLLRKERGTLKDIYRAMCNFVTVNLKCEDDAALYALQEGAQIRCFYFLASAFFASARAFINKKPLDTPVIWADLDATSAQ